MSYESRYVAFVDILGFSQIVVDSSKDPTPDRFDALEAHFYACPREAWYTRWTRTSGLPKDRYAP
jgi:hypothetical protein